MKKLRNLTIIFPILLLFGLFIIASSLEESWSARKVEKQILTKFMPGDIVLHKLNGQRGILTGNTFLKTEWVITWDTMDRGIVNEVEITLEK